MFLSANIYGIRFMFFRSIICHIQGNDFDFPISLMIFNFNISAVVCEENSIHNSMEDVKFISRAYILLFMCAESFSDHKIHMPE